MEINISNKDCDLFQYEHIYKVLNDNFVFNEEKYGLYIKDVIKILKELERVGETSIEIDKRKILIDLFKSGWPEEHLKALKNSGLLNNLKSPIYFEDRKLSFIKWIKKIDKILNIFQNKLNIEKFIEQPEKSDFKDNIEKIVYLFDLSDLVFLQGGPGTGKSTIIIKLIQYYLNKKNLINIGIGAPTGKASARLKEALECENQFLFKNGLENIECQTLHRWIYNSSNKKGKLKFKLKELDLFVIDEMSMVNIDLIESILELLANDCKILLVGDANQLPPINNCSIWNHIFSNIKINIFKKFTINLTEVYRNNGDIEALSKLIFQKDEYLFNAKIQNIIETKGDSNIKIINTSNNKIIPKELINDINVYIHYLKKSTIELSKKKYIFKSSEDNLLEIEEKIISEIFENLNSHLILCEKNTGTWSVQEINKVIINQSEPYDFLTLEEGLPIMCTENNNELGISNGDIGILVGNKDNRRFLFKKFNKKNETVIALIKPEKLESIVPAIAITIHKAQGSECKKVSILWNKKNENKILNPEIELNEKYQIFFRDNFEKRLFYTAITRAKESLRIYS